MVKHRYNTSNKQILIYTGLSIVLILIIGLFLDRCTSQKQGCPTNFQQFQCPASKSLFIWNLIQKNDIKYDTLVFKQGQYESNYFKSELCTKYNNIFGMGIPDMKRKSTCIGLWTPKGCYYSKDQKQLLGAYWEFGGYGIYNSLEDCVLDYKYFQDYILQKSYKNYLNQYYSQTNNYLTKIQSIK